MIHRKCWGSIAGGYQTLMEKEKRNSNEKGKVTLKARQIVVVKSRPLGGAHAGLFIVEVKGLITIP
jgi:hypothetical protein